MDENRAEEVKQGNDTLKKMQNEFAVGASRLAGKSRKRTANVDTSAGKAGSGPAGGLKKA